MADIFKFYYEIDGEKMKINIESDDLYLAQHKFKDFFDEDSNYKIIKIVKFNDGKNELVYTWLSTLTKTDIVKLICEIDCAYNTCLGVLYSKPKKQLIKMYLNMEKEKSNDGNSKKEGVSV